MAKQKKTTPTKKKVKAVEKKWYAVVSADWVSKEMGGDGCVYFATSPEDAIKQYAGDDLDFDGSIAVAELTNIQVYQSKVTRNLVVYPNKQLGDTELEDDENR